MPVVAIPHSQIRKFRQSNVSHYHRCDALIHPLQFSLQSTFDLQKNPFWNNVHYAFYMYEKAGNTWAEWPY